MDREVSLVLPVAESGITARRIVFIDFIPVGPIAGLEHLLLCINQISLLVGDNALSRRDILYAVCDLSGLLVNWVHIFFVIDEGIETFNPGIPNPFPETFSGGVDLLRARIIGSERL